jgi:hypothetical protein
VNNDPVNFVDRTGLGGCGAPVCDGVTIHGGGDSRVDPEGGTPGVVGAGSVGILLDGGEDPSGGAGEGGGEGEQDPLQQDPIKHRRAQFLKIICDPNVIKQMTEAFMRAGNGESRTEAGFIRYELNGQVGYKNLPNTNEPDKITFEMDKVLPSGATLLEIYHTHATRRDQYPSPGDKNTANSDVKVPVFVIHRNGLSVYDPQTQQTYSLRESIDWQKECS